MKRLLLVVALVGAIALSATTPSSARDDGGDDTGASPPAGPAGLISAEFDAFAVRVEYDIPLPAGTGSVPHVVGEVRRSGAGENAKGLSAAPSQMDAVVGGKYANPDADTKGDERNLPQVECFYPGDLVNTRFDFPTQTQPQTAPAPPVGYAVARCGAGPEVGLEARNGAAVLPGISIGGGVADGGARPASGVLQSAASARASDVKLADGAVTIRSVEANGASHTNGQPGGAATDSRVALTDVTAGGVQFSVANDRIVLAGTTVPLDAASTATLVTTINGALAPAGCRIDLLSHPEAYPQGFLLGRKPPTIGVSADGSLAASMQGGLLVVCDLPKDATEPTTFSPQRMQVLVGFAYTGVAANAEPGGFSLGSLGSFTEDGGFSSFDTTESTTVKPPDLAAVAAGSHGAMPELPAAAPVDAAAPPAAAAPAPPPPAPRARLAAVDFAMDPAHRAVLALLCLPLWALLTHLGLRRLRGVTEG
jgi:hypothetical protein